MAQQAGRPNFAETPNTQMNWHNASKKAEELFDSGRQYAAKHPYQVLLGAAGIAGLSALTVYLLRKRNH